MHALDRTCVQPPACLGAYNHHTQTWDDLSGDCKRRLRAALVQMQGIPEVTTPDANEYGLRCAYCEGAIHNEGHIEHFRRKNPKHHPELTFIWTNLFLSCGERTHCGHYKDRPGAPAYDPAQLIKPDVHDPNDFLYFHSSGEVREKAGIDAVDRARARETIRVFGLDNPVLAGKRAWALSIYRQKIIADIDELAHWPVADRQEYLTKEFETVRHEPYATTIRHFLAKQA